jgi:hypothetical protein
MAVLPVPGTAPCTPAGSGEPVSSCGARAWRLRPGEAVGARHFAQEVVSRGLAHVVDEHDSYGMVVG